MSIMIDVACSRLKPTCTPAGSRSHEPDEGTCTLDILFNFLARFVVIMENLLALVLMGKTTRT